MDKENVAKAEAMSFKFGVAFGQFSAVANPDNYKAVENVLSGRMRKALPAYEDLKKTLWWEFQPDRPYLDDGCYHIGLLVYLRFLLSLPGHLEPEQRRKQIGETEESLKEGFESQRYPMNILDDFLLNLHRIDPNEALRIFVDKFASIFVSDIARIIAQGESATVEFKPTLKVSKKESDQARIEVKKEISAAVAGFLNVRSGGTLIIGVEDDGNPTGELLERGGFGNEDKASEYLLDLLVQKLGVNAAKQTSFDFSRIKGELVLAVRCVFDINVFPIYVPQDLPPSKRILYVRMGATTRKLGGEEQIRYIDSVRS